MSSNDLPVTAEYIVIKLFIPSLPSAYFTTESESVTALLNFFNTLK